MPTDNEKIKQQYESEGGPALKRVVLADDGSLPGYVKVAFWAAGLWIGVMLLLIMAQEIGVITFMQ